MVCKSFYVTGFLTINKKLTILPALASNTFSTAKYYPLCDLIWWLLVQMCSAYWPCTDWLIFKEAFVYAPLDVLNFDLVRNNRGYHKHTKQVILALLLILYSGLFVLFSSCYYILVFESMDSFHVKKVLHATSSQRPNLPGYFKNLNSVHKLVSKIIRQEKQTKNFEMYMKFNVHPHLKE